MYAPVTLRVLEHRRVGVGLEAAHDPGVGAAPREQDRRVARARDLRGGVAERLGAGVVDPKLVVHLAQPLQRGDHPQRARAAVPAVAARRRVADQAEDPRLARPARVHVRPDDVERDLHGRRCAPGVLELAREHGGRASLDADVDGLPGGSGGRGRGGGRGCRGGLGRRSRRSRGASRPGPRRGRTARVARDRGARPRAASARVGGSRSSRCRRGSRRRRPRARRRARTPRARGRCASRDPRARRRGGGGSYTGPVSGASGGGAYGRSRSWGRRFGTGSSARGSSLCMAGGGRGQGRDCCAQPATAGCARAPPRVAVARRASRTRGARTGTRSPSHPRRGSPRGARLRGRSRAARAGATRARCAYRNPRTPCACGGPRTGTGGPRRRPPSRIRSPGPSGERVPEVHDPGLVGPRPEATVADEAIGLLAQGDRHLVPLAGLVGVAILEPGRRRRAPARAGTARSSSGSGRRPGRTGSGRRPERRRP